MKRRLVLAGWLVISLFASSSPAQTAPVSNKALQRQLLNMDKEDQKYRLEQMKLMSQVYGPGKEKAAARLKQITPRQEALDRKLIAELEAIIQRYGWPTVSMVGKKANNAAFLILQHADTKLQKKYFPLLKEAAAKKEANPADAAMMEDRILMADGKKQIYGTQLTINDQTKKWTVYQIEDEQNVDARRASVGLPPMAEYLKLFEENFGAPKKKK